MHDRIHEHAAPRPVREFGGQIEVISLRILQKFSRRGVPNVEIADRSEHVAVEQRIGLLEREADSERERRQRRMIGPQRAGQRLVASGGVEKINEIG